MDRATFLKALGKRLYPMLREEGFRGSGNTLRRINEPVVHVFNVQGSSGGTCCYLNLSAHLTFLPKEGGGELDVKSLKEYECVFRGRYDPPSGPTQGWSYGSNADEMNETISFICDHWSIYGHEFFNRYTEFPADFATLVDEAKASQVHPIALLTLARIAAHLGKNERAETLIREGLQRCPERASGLRNKLDQVLGDLT